jgi:predicted TIM-barrel fold metal-dependent hydrolase
LSGYIDAHGHSGDYGRMHVPRSSAEDLVRRMDAMGVERLLLARNASFSSDYSWGNRRSARAAEDHAGRIYFYTVVNPNYAHEAVEELERYADHPACVGVKLHAAVHEHPLEGDGYAETWSWVEERGLPVLIHFWVSCGFCGTENVRKVAARHPRVRIILAHLGGTGNDYLGLPALGREHPGLWFDTCGSRHSRGAVRYMVEEGMGERLLYGSDMPFIDPGSQLGKILHAEISEEARGAILRANALRLFGWEELEA